MPIRKIGHLIWIDGICINQNDPSERKSQVLLMGKIYHRCRRLVIWLGIGTATSNLAIESLDQYRKTQQKRNTNRMRRFDQSIIDSGLAASTIDDLEKLVYHFLQVDNNETLPFTQWLHASKYSEDEVNSLPGCRFLMENFLDSSL